MPPRTPDSVLLPFLPQLGHVPDHLIARQAGVSRALVISFRKRHNIAAYDGYKFGKTETTPSERPVRERAAAPSTPAAFRGRRSSLDPFVEQLGRIPDNTIAHLAGVTAENVRTYRARRGIPALWQQERRGESGKGPGEPTSPAPSAGTLPASSGETSVSPAATPRTAYLLNVDAQGSAESWAIIATDFGDAAVQAVGLISRQCPGASIRAIQRIATLLE